MSLSLLPFVLSHVLPLGRSRAATPRMAAPAPAERVIVENNAGVVAQTVLERLDRAAQRAISERGHFVLAVPGGSVLKMLEDTSPAWAADTTLVYVNHKCVALDEAALSTHAKAVAFFLDGWAGVTTLVLGGSVDADAEAAAYETQLRELPVERLPRGDDGLPCFDMMLLGVGDDGHVGSLYPGRPEVLEAATGRWVLPVDLKTPGSITLSLPVMAAAKDVLIAACGVSNKSPAGKSQAMVRAIESEEEDAASFPAAGLRGVATWVLDLDAARELGFDYADCFAFQGASPKTNFYD